MAEGRQLRTRLFRAIVGGVFAGALREGRILHNPVANLSKLTDRSGARKKPFSIDDVRKLLAAVEGDWKGAILCGYSSGMRISDVANLRWENIDFDAGVVAFHQRKTQATGDEQTIVGLHADFEQWLKSQPPGAGPIFPTLAGRHTSGEYGLSAEFGRIMERAGIESAKIREGHGQGRTVRALSFHSFRHGAASHVFRAKVIEEAQKRDHRAYARAEW